MTSTVGPDYPLLCAMQSLHLHMQHTRASSSLHPTRPERNILSHKDPSLPQENAPRRPMVGGRRTRCQRQQKQARRFAWFMTGNHTTSPTLVSRHSRRYSQASTGSLTPYRMGVSREISRSVRADPPPPPVPQRSSKTFKERYLKPLFDTTLSFYAARLLAYSFPY